MQNSSESNLPSVKYHNVWAFIVAIVLTLIPVGLQIYSDTRGIDAKQQVRIEEANKLIDQLKVKLNSVDNATAECKTNIQAINRTLDSTNVLGAATGSAIRKLGPTTEISPVPLKYGTPTPTPTEIILYVPTGTATLTPRPTPIK